MHVYTNLYGAKQRRTARVDVGALPVSMRYLTRWRLSGILDERGVLAANYHLVFLGDLIDRGVYGYELLVLVYLLKTANPATVHVNRGNHEDHGMSYNMGADRSLYSQMLAKLPDSANRIYKAILACFDLQHSAMAFRVAG